ncbi:hypothetical protein V6N13_088713 [Hibiscus sabdariffa]
MDARLLGSEEENSENMRKRVWEESKKLWKIGFPSILARVTTFGMYVMTQAFIGHIGQLKLASYALIQVIVVQFSNGVLCNRDTLWASIWSKIIPHVGEDEEIASDAGYMSLWFIPMLYSYVLNFTIQKYLQFQLKNTIVGWISVDSFVVHVLLSWIFMSKMNWGIPGAMSSMIISN